MTPIVQWNCCGLGDRQEDLRLLCKDLKPSVILLQETKLTPNTPFSLQGYKPFRKDNPTGVPSGGAALLVSEDTLLSEVDLDTPLHAVAARVSLHRTITFCSVYLPPSATVTKETLLHLISQLPTPFVIMGDLNGHSPLWGSEDTNARGRIIESVVEQLDLCIFNDGSPTFTHNAYGTSTHLDLTLCDPSLLLDFEWHVHGDMCGSDHYPTVITPVVDEEEESTGRWNLKKADWSRFKTLCESKFSTEDILQTADPIATFTNILTDIASECIPRTTTVPRGPRVPWFNQECKEIRLERKTAQRRAKRTPTQANILTYKRLRAKARRVFRTNRKRSWREFVSSLTSKTPSQKVWKAIRKIKGKGSVSSIGHLRAGDQLVTDKKAVANLLASTISKNSSSGRYSARFQKVKATKEKKTCNFNSDQSEDYNNLFSITELEQALQKANNSAAGLDGIHYQLLTHLPEEALCVLLNIFNHVWVTGAFPPSWREAEVIPIPKPGRDPSNPGNYRPIALTSCICKTMERLVNARLTWHLEKHGLISDLQCGFRQGRSTVDHLVRFETFIREAFVKKQHVLAVFFDLEKAYDTTWKHGILSDMHEMGFRGRLPVFIREFLEGRSFRVRVGSTHSDPVSQEMGVPQGSILSPVLFSIKINNIVKAVTSGTDASLFVDDFALCVRGSALHRVERALQLCVNRVQNWVSDNGFKFSPSKTTCVHFHRVRGVFGDPDIRIDGSPITVATEAKFLGVIFDQKLKFISHIKYVRKSCQKALDVLRVVGHTDWGADRTVLLRLYRSLVRSKLDYGCIVWGSARKSYIQILDPVHHAGLRICIGAFRTSPVDSLYVEAGEPSLAIRRMRLAMNYVLKLRSYPDNPAYKCVFEPNFEEEFANNENEIPPLSLRVRPHLEAAGIDLKQVEESLIPTSPPWTLPTPEVNFDLTQYKKGAVPNEQFLASFREMLDLYKFFWPIFTDGSKSEEPHTVGAAAVYMQKPPNTKKHRLLDKSSIYTAELQAIMLALEHIKQSKEGNFLILSDSLSALQALANNKFDHPLLVQIRVLHSELLEDNKDIIFAWVPSHIGIRGNSLADRAANEARRGEVKSKTTIFSDFKPDINRYMHAQWQNAWDDQTENKLHKIVSKVGDVLPRCRPNRREEVVLGRLHIGHSHFTHSYLLKGEEMPFCYACDEPDTIEHILISCGDLCEVRQNFYSAESMELLFRNVPPDKIFAFLKAVDLFYKI